MSVSRLRSGRSAESTLVQLYGALRWLQPADPIQLIAWQRQQRRRRMRQLERFAAAGIRTPRDLAAALPELKGRRFEHAAHFAEVLELRELIPALRREIDHPRYRGLVLHVLAVLRDRSTWQRILGTARTVLDQKPANSRMPLEDAQRIAGAVDMSWNFESQVKAEFLVQVFERRDLPGWLRGEAGDKLGQQTELDDRRTSLFRRAIEAAVAGIHERDLDVRFWSLYVLMTLASGAACRRGGTHAGCTMPTQCWARLVRRALPQLCRIAATDKRWSPGFWWPVSAEAEDAIQFIEHRWHPREDAAERWSGRGRHGPVNRPH